MRSIENPLCEKVAVIMRKQASEGVGGGGKPPNLGTGRAAARAPARGVAKTAPAGGLTLPSGYSCRYAATRAGKIGRGHASPRSGQLPPEHPGGRRTHSEDGP